MKKLIIIGLYSIFMMASHAQQLDKISNELEPEMLAAVFAQLNEAEQLQAKNNLLSKGLKNIDIAPGAFNKRLQDQAFRQSLYQAFGQLDINVEKAYAWLLLNHYLVRFHNDASQLEKAKAYLDFFFQVFEAELPESANVVEAREIRDLKEVNIKALEAIIHLQNFHAETVISNTIKVLCQENTKGETNLLLLKAKRTHARYSVKLTKHWSEIAPVLQQHWDRIKDHPEIDGLSKYQNVVERAVTSVINFAPDVNLRGYKQSPVLIEAFDFCYQTFLQTGQPRFLLKSAIQVFQLAREHDETEAIYLSYPRYITLVAMDYDNSGIREIPRPEAKALVDELNNLIKQSDREGLLFSLNAEEVIVKIGYSCAMIESELYGKTDWLTYIGISNLLRSIRGVMREQARKK